MDHEEIDYGVQTRYPFELDINEEDCSISNQKCRQYRAVHYSSC